MHELIQELQSFHKEKARQLFKLEKCVNDFPEYGPYEEHTNRLRELLELFQSEAEAAHHHNEEAILDELRKTPAPIHRRVDEISGDHEAFNENLAAISAKIRDNSVESAVLCSIIKSFIATYSDHAEGEENIFFPMADKFLESSHWARIKKAWK